MFLRVVRPLPRGSHAERAVGELVDAAEIGNARVLIEAGYFEPVDDEDGRQAAAPAPKRESKPKRSTRKAGRPVP